MVQPLLRRLSRDDMDEVAIIHRKAFDNQFPWLVGFHSPAEDRAFFRDRVFGECEVWGALDEALIGFIAFRSGWIDKLYILPRRQRQGVGGATDCEGEKFKSPAVDFSAELGRSALLRTAKLL